MKSSAVEDGQAPTGSDARSCAPRVILAGASLDTSNLGVSALGASVIAALARRQPGAEIGVLDYSNGVSCRQLGSNGQGIEYERVGARFTKRIWRPESWWRIALESRLGGMANPSARRLCRADVVLDISGGDSFTDLYGTWRFKSVANPKFWAIQHRKPLILLPQTYGPFRSRTIRARAAFIVQHAVLAWARDGWSFEVLRDLLGDQFDRDRHRCGVDVAFGLEPSNPDPALPSDLRQILESDDPAARPIGINISGLIYHDRDAAKVRYGIVADYPEVIAKLLVGLLDRTAVPVLLVPHVLAAAGHYESDPEACRLARAGLPRSRQPRVHVVPADLGAAEMKWVISRCQWFCGTRMHATIAALSSGVPTAAIAYSDKTRGVFETCGQGEHVADSRVLDTVAVVKQILRSWSERDAARQSLGEHLPAVLDQAERQMDEIVAFIASLKTETRPSVVTD